MKVPPNSWNETPESLLSKAYDNNFDWCLRYVRRNNGTAEDASDIFQESISTAWINLKEGKFQGDFDHFNAYIRQICKHKWINQLRSFANNKIILKEDFSDYESRIDLSPSDEYSMELDLLENSFTSIGEKCRDLLSRFYFKKESLSTIAEKMEFNEGSIKTMKYRCMMRLRKAYLDRSQNNE